MTTADILTLIFAGAALILSVITIFYAGGQTKAARDAADAAEAQAGAANKQVEEMQRQTALTLASITPQLTLEFTRIPTIVFQMGAIRERRYTGTYEWRLHNYGSSAALDVTLILNWDPNGVQYGQVSASNVPGGEFRELSSPRGKIHPIDDAREISSGDVLGATVRFKTIAGAPDEVFVPVTERDERDT